MVKRKPILILANTTTEDERSSKGGFFANWFGHGSTRTETRDETDYSGEESVGSDSIEDAYPNYAGHERKSAEVSSSFKSDTDFETGDDESLLEFDRELRGRHAQACKYMRVSVESA